MFVRLPKTDPATFMLVMGLLICLFIGLPACTSMQSDFETPTVTISSFRAVPSQSTVPDFEIGLRVINPNSAPLKLQGIAYTITLEDRELIKGVGKDLPVIEGYSEGTFTVTASMSFYEGLQLLGDLMNNPRDRIRYDLETKLDVGTFMPAIRVRDSGEISLQTSK